MSERIPDGTVTITAAAAQLSVSRRTTERYIANGRLKAVRTHTGRVCVHQSSIDKLLQPVPIQSSPRVADAEASDSAIPATIAGSTLVRRTRTADEDSAGAGPLSPAPAPTKTTPGNAADEPGARLLGTAGVTGDGA